MQKPHRDLWRLLFLLLGALLGSCRPASITPKLPSPLTEAGYQDYTGAIHVHSLYSPDGRGSFDEITRAAVDRGLTYVVITDHDTLAGLREEREGWHQGVLVLVGSETSTSYGHCLTMGLTGFWGEEKTHGKVPAEELFALVQEQDALVFIAHPYHPGAPWSQWEVTGYTGMEIYNLQVSLVQRDILGHLKNAFFTAFKLRLDFASLLRRPEGNLRIWDNLLREGKRVVGVGSVDAHGRLSVLGWTIDSYARFFRLVQNHVLSREAFNGKLEHDKALLYKALKEGHVYVSFGIWGNPEGFSYLALGEKGLKGIMGDEVGWRPGCCRVLVTVPQNAAIKLIRNGEEVGKSTGREFEAAIDYPGTYRVEVYRTKGLGHKLWILSNPIYFVRREESAR